MPTDHTPSPGLPLRPFLLGGAALALSLTLATSIVAVALVVTPPAQGRDLKPQSSPELTLSTDAGPLLALVE